MVKVAIVILSYNTKKLLQQCLTSLFKVGNSKFEIRNSKPRKKFLSQFQRGRQILNSKSSNYKQKLSLEIEIIVIDNGSTDGSKEYLKKLKKLAARNWEISSPATHEISSDLRQSEINFRKRQRANFRQSPISQFPNFKVIFNNRNRGFIYSCNRGVKEAKGEFVVLLNSDVVPKKGFLEATLPHFRDPEVFAVSFNEQQFGWAKIWWRGGFIHHGVGGRPNKPHITAWASGGSAVFRKSIWEKLGGFDPLYHPFYWEDFDLGYRAWKAGYKIVWEPKAVVEHRHESTISRLDRQYVEIIKERNQLLFIWKNITNRWWRISNILGVMLRILLGPNYLKVVWSAWRRYRRFAQTKSSKVEQEKLSDKEVVGLFKND